MYSFAILGFIFPLISGSAIKSLYRGLKFNKELDFIWKLNIGDKVTIESNAWKNFDFNPSKPDFSMSQRHTFKFYFSFNESPLMSFSDKLEVAESFAKSNYGVILKFDYDMYRPNSFVKKVDKPYINKITKESESE